MWTQISGCVNSFSSKLMCKVSNAHAFSGSANQLSSACLERPKVSALWKDQVVHSRSNGLGTKDLQPPNRDGYAIVDNAQILTLELRVSLLMVFIPFIFSSAVEVEWALSLLWTWHFLYCAQAIKGWAV